MFARSQTPAQTSLRRVRIVSADAALAARLKPVLSELENVQIDTVTAPLGEGIRQSLLGASLLLIDLGTGDDSVWSALEKLVVRLTERPPIVLLSDKLGEVAARRLLKLEAADWLHRNSAAEEIVGACEIALNPSLHAVRRKSATCLAFQSAIGGAGSTTLAIAAAAARAMKGNGSAGRSCVVDLNFQAGAVADYLDVRPNLDVAEISAAPERLDAHLLEVMLSKHASGLSVLAAVPDLGRSANPEPETIGRLLDLVASNFDHVVLDLPRQWSPWSEVVVKGVDKHYLVTELTIPGLRQARRIVDALGERYSVDTQRSVIVNKRPLFCGNVKPRHAKEMLGPALAGFLPMRTNVTREAQDRGVLLSEISRRNAIESALHPLVARR